MPTKPLWDGPRAREFAERRGLTHVERLKKVLEAHRVTDTPEAIAALNTLIEDEVFQIRLEAKLEAGSIEEAERMVLDYLKANGKKP